VQVFGKNKAAFKKVFEIAQDQLRHHFGMEMVELPLKEKITLKDRRGTIHIHSSDKQTLT
jgi:hypothetical protein